MEPSLSSVKLIVGLGNPGADYRTTYHNAGALFIAFLEKAADTPKNKKSTPLYTTAQIGTQWTATPKTFMNESGRAVRAALTARKTRPDALLVAHDDSDIPLGKFKFAFGRGAAGHRGVASVIAALGTDQFWRLRIGVRGRPGKAGSFVLRQISAADQDMLYSVFGGAYEKLTVNVRP